MQLWRIIKVTHANDETVDKFADRNRIGKLVSNTLPLKVGMPLRLVYVGGEKEGGIIQHSSVVRVEKDENGTKLYTANTMVLLEEVRG